LTHASGIYDYVGLPDLNSFERRRLTPAQLISLVSNEPLVFTPGSSWQYSNSGYVILGAIIERVSGVSYAQFLSRNVLSPLGLHATGYDTNHPTLPQHATGYSGWSERASYIDMSVPYAAGALYSTTEDLYHYDEALMSGRPPVLPRTLLQSVFARHVLIDPGAPKQQYYGYGWFIGGHGQSLYYAHGGDINGFASYDIFFPRSAVIVVVLSNLDSSDVPHIAYRLLAIANAAR
jgi:CubicO group peptidase (beta-lactamase class C family)